MLKNFTLYVIDKIFSETKCKLPAHIKMLYITCLIHHFKQLEPVEWNLREFSITLKELNYAKFSASYNLLEQAGLIRIESDSILFLNLWGEFIDKASLSINSLNETDSFFHPPIKFREDILSSHSMKEHFAMRLKIPEALFIELVDKFISEQSASERKYGSYRDFSSHFVNWSKFNSDKPAQQVVKSSSKRLGD